MEPQELQSILASLEGRSVTPTRISLYVAAGTLVHKAHQRVRDEMVLAENIKSRVVRKGVESALQTLHSMLRVYRVDETTERGLALFASGDAENWAVDGTPRPIVTSRYHCGNSYLLDPLLEQLEARELYGLIVMDRKEASLGVLHGDYIHRVDNFESRVMGKHHMGGSSQHRFERQIREQVHGFYKKVAERANLAFLPLVLSGKLKGIGVGGPGMTKTEWVNAALMDYRLRALVMDPDGEVVCYETGYTDDYQGLKELSVAIQATITSNTGRHPASLRD